MGAERFVSEQEDVNHPDIDRKMELLYGEMREVFHLY